MVYLDHRRGKDNWPERIDLQLPNDDLISAINYVNSNLIYVGTNKGRVYCLTKQGDGWVVNALQNPLFPRRYIWDVATLPTDDRKIVVVVSGFGTPHVLFGDVQQNGSTAAWTDISGAGDSRLPDIPVNAIVIDENRSECFYVGTDVGVFQTTDAGKTWKSFNEGLPNCQVYDMRLYSRSDLLRAATHGRGMWERKIG